MLEVCENAKSLGVRIIVNFPLFSVGIGVVLMFLGFCVIGWPVHCTFVDFYCRRFDGKGD
jgi:hypothetical protein